MFGPRPSRRERSLAEECVGRRDRVVWLRGNDNMLADLYASADCLVYPSLTEGFGMPLVEAARQGCPIACSDIEPFHEVLGEEAVFFDPTERGSIMGAVQAAIAAGRQAPRVLAAARRSDVFSWPEMCRQTGEFYAHVLEAA